MLQEGMESGVEDGSGVKVDCGKLWLFQDNGPGLAADDRFPHPQHFKKTNPNHEADLPPMDRPYM
jgi:hypothetical protein